MLNELIGLKVNVLFITVLAVRDAMGMTKTIPIVSCGFDDPMAEGFVGSFSRPGRNVTGMAWQSSEVDTKRLQIALEVLPKLKSVAFLIDATDRSGLLQASRLVSAAPKTGSAAREFLHE